MNLKYFDGIRSYPLEVRFFQAFCQLSMGFSRKIEYILINGFDSRFYCLENPDIFNHPETLTGQIPLTPSTFFAHLSDVQSNRNQPSLRLEMNGWVR